MTTRANEASLSENDLLRMQQRKKDDDYAGDGTVDLHGKRVLKSKTGNWKACPFILGTECSERVAYYGISTNLVNYLTGKLHEGNVSAARNVTTWAGTCYLTPIIGAILADAFWGRYWTIALFSAIYFIGMCVLALSAAVPALRPDECVGSICPSATFMQYAIFFSGLYLVSLGTGGIKPCVYPFGADQFDCTDPKERVKKGSFFNWFYFVLYIGALISSTFIVWIQENAGWGLGFGIPALFMGISIASFLGGTTLYRFQKPTGSPVTRLCQVLVASYRKRKLDLPRDSSLLYRTPDKDPATTGVSQTLEHTDELRCLDKAAIVTDADREAGDSTNGWRLCTVTQVEELKVLVHMVPVWSNFIIFSAVYCQILTMFVEQGMVMNRTIGSFVIPAASLSTFEVLSILFFVPVYDKLIVPLVRRCTGKERGFSELQRMGIGLFITIFSMVAAAILESKRLQIAQKHGLVDENVAVPLSILWQIPQYFLVGTSEVFGYIGQMEFFYNQAPDSMRSVCSAFYLLNIGLGNYLSSFLVTVLSAATTAGGKPGWLPDNMNKGHLDYFFWLLAGLSFINLMVYLVFSMRYKQKKTTAPFRTVGT